MNSEFLTNRRTEIEQLVLKKTLDIVCGKWRLYIVYQLSDGARRYGELRRMIPEISEKVLVQELKALIELGVVDKKMYHEVPPRVEYNLTKKAQEILPMLMKFMAIGEAFMESPQNP